MRGLDFFVRALRASPLRALGRLGLDYLQFSAACLTTAALLLAKHPVRLAEQALGRPIRQTFLDLFARVAEW
jgi:hypothetical protein